MDGAPSKELSVSETRYGLEDFALLTNLKSRLKPNQIPHLTCPILTPELNDSPRTFTCFWASKPNRLHRTKSQCIHASRGHNFNWKTSFKVWNGVPIMPLMSHTTSKCFNKGQILRLGHRTIEIICILIKTPRCKNYVFIKSLSVHNRGNRIKER